VGWFLWQKQTSQVNPSDKKHFINKMRAWKRPFVLYEEPHGSLLRAIIPFINKSYPKIAKRVYSVIQFLFMIKLFCLTLFGILFFTPTAKSTLTEKERAYLLDYFKTTKDRLLNNVKGLSEDQLNFKPDPERWSVAECIEHITVTENTNMDRIMEVLKTDADPSDRSKITVTDEVVLKRYTDRSSKRKTGETLIPTNRFGSYEATLKAFVEKRNSNIDFISKTQDDLRNRITTFSYGTVDLYQCLLALVAHSERHIVQLEEVIADPKFPK
jgi:hypothetical protein